VSGLPSRPEGLGLAWLDHGIGQKYCQEKFLTADEPRAAVPQLSVGAWHAMPLHSDQMPSFQGFPPTPGSLLSASIRVHLRLKFYPFEIGQSML
jgi:hypothetical protein